jgi:TonB dependent receptor-like, beta-barrel/TonB-dependent Receptor Plug Domain
VRVTWKIAAIAAAMIAASCAHADTGQSGVQVYQASYFADAHATSAYDMIERLPGFAFQDSGTARGFAGTAGNVLVNGQRPTSKTDDLQSILTRIPAAEVARIEIISGGAAGIDMHDQTVVANVILKTADSTIVTAKAEEVYFPNGESVPNASVNYSRHSGDVVYDASLSRLSGYDDSVGNRGTNVIIAPDGTVTKQHASNAGRGSGGGATGDVSFPLWGGTFKTNFTLEAQPFRSNLIYSAPGFHQAFTDSSGDNQMELGLHWEGPIGKLNVETLILQRLGHQTDLNQSFAALDDERFASTENTGETIARARIDYPVSDSLTLEAAAEGAFNFLDGKSDYTVNGTAIPVPSGNAYVDERRGEAFTQANWKISKQLDLEAGARFEFSTIAEIGDTDESRSFFYPKPRLLLTWSPNSHTDVRLRLERVVGQLDFTDFIASSNLSSSGVSAGNPELRPDQHDQYEIAFERHFWDKGAVTLTLMHENITDVTDLVPVFTPTGDFDAPGNIGNGTNNQLDLESTLPLDRFGLPGGQLKSSIILLHSEVRDPTTEQQRIISGQRPQDINISLTQDIDSLKSTWGINYFNCWDERYYRLAYFEHDRVVPPYFQVYWAYKPTPDWNLRAEVDNVVPFIYEKRLVYYTGPRNVAPVDYTQLTVLRSQPQFILQIVKTFN